MANSKVELVNNALALLGEDSITSLEDDTVRATTAARLYDTCRDACLRLRKWNFALSRVALARLTVAPSWGYSYAFQLPSDCLRLWETDIDDLFPFTIEGRTLLTDSEKVNVLYTYRCDDPVVYDSLFADAFASRLARDLAWPVCQSRALISDMDSIYRDKLKEAQTADGMEGTPPQLKSDSLTEVR